MEASKMTAKVAAKKAAKKKTAQKAAAKKTAKRKPKAAKMVAKKATAKRKAASTKKTGAKPGAKSQYTKARGHKVCTLIIQGETLSKIAQRAGMPSVPTICKWLRDYPEFLDEYQAARELQSMLDEEAILELADTASNETWKVRHLQIEARKWLMAKRAPKRYGRQVALTGKDGGPIKTETTVSGILDEIDGAGTGLGSGGQGN